jgi:hypothetical protein
LNYQINQTSKLRPEVDTQEESANNDRLLSESAYTDSQGVKRKKKSKIFIPT